MKLNQRDNILSLMNFRKPNSQSLENAAEAADRSVFERHFTENWTSICRLLARMLGDPAEAEDLALETFYRLYQHLPSQDQKFNARGWLYRVATNLGLNSIRNFKRREYYETQAAKDLITETPKDSPLEILDEQEERQTARNVLAMMNPRQSQLLILRYSGKPYKEIAQTLKLSPTSIGPLLLRAEHEFEIRYRTLKKEDL